MLSSKIKELIRIFVIEFNLSSPQEIAICFVFVALPFSIKLVNIVLCLFVLTMLPKYSLKKIVQAYSENGSNVVINVLPFIFAAATLLYSTNPALGLKHLETYLPLFILPLTLPLLRIKRINLVFGFFVATIVFMELVCLVNSTWLLLTTESGVLYVGDNYNKVETWWNVYTNEILLTPFNIDPIYLSLYVGFAIFFVIIREPFSLRLRILILFFLSVFLVLIGSRATFAGFVLSLFALSFFIKSINSKRYLVPIFVCACLLIAANPVLVKRYYTDLITLGDIPSATSDWNGANIRFAIWGCQIKLFSKSNGLGLGVGGQVFERQECYKTYSFYPAFGTDFNAHNQFLEFLVIGGLPLMLLFCLQILNSLYFALTRSDLLFFSFLLLFTIVCFGESLLERNKGIVFFSLINCIFLFNRSETKKN